MTQMTLPAAPAPVSPGGTLPRLIARLPFRDMVMAAALVLAATAALHAQDRITAWTQDWVPMEIAVPDDAELLSDREIGSTVRMFSFSTAEDIDLLFAAWEGALIEGGFIIDQGADDLLERSIEFSGSGIANAKIVAGLTAEDGRTVIEVDATLQ